LLLAGVVAFIGWEWQQAPNGLIPGAGSGQVWSDRHDDD
jgi:hypothetical protein